MGRQGLAFALIAAAHGMRRTTHDTTWQASAQGAHSPSEQRVFDAGLCGRVLVAGHLLDGVLHQFLGAFHGCALHHAFANCAGQGLGGKTLRQLLSTFLAEG